MSDVGPKGSVTIGEGVVVHGTITAPGKATVFGVFDGELSASEVLIGRSGRVAGRLIADIVEVQGEGPEQLTARQSLTVRSTGHVSGTVRYGRLEVEPGGAIDGTLVPVVEQSFGASPAGDMAALTPQSSA